MFKLFFIGFLFLSCQTEQSTNQKNRNVQRAMLIKSIENQRFEYDSFNSNRIAFIEFTIPIEIENIKDEDDKASIKYILNDKNILKSDPIFSFFNEEYSNNEMINLDKLGKFKFRNDIYYYLFFSNFLYNCGECPSFCVLYKKNKINNRLNRIQIGYQASFTPKCFDDYDDDGNLDYLHWYYNDTAKLFSINNIGDLIVNKKYEIILTQKDLNNWTIKSIKGFNLK